MTERELIKFLGGSSRFEHQERADWNLEKFEAEFADRLYSDYGRRVVESLNVIDQILREEKSDVSKSGSD